MPPWLQGLSSPVTLAALSDAGVFLSLEHQMHLADVLGEHAWQVDLGVPSFSVTGDHPLTCTAMYLLGSAAPGPRSWLWSWANPSGFAPAATGLAAWLRAFGEQHGITELTTAELPFADLPGASQEPAGAAWALVDAAKAACGCWTSYTGDAGGGTRVAFLIEHPDFNLGAPRGPRVMRVLQEGLAGRVTITDHRRAVRAYAAARGLDAAWTERSVALGAPGLSLAIEFDERDRVRAINGTMREA
jgi:hypothetical protein